MTAQTPPVALTIAGSDSGGGAGIQADLTTFAAFGVHGTSAITAITAQDTTGVHDILSIPADLVVAQVQAVLTDLPPAAVKVGMLGDPGVARAVAQLAATGRLAGLVVDPVLVSTSGHCLAAEGVVRVLVDELLPHATLVTPNADEAAALLGRSPATDLDEQVDQATALLDLGPRTVVITGSALQTDAGADRVDVVASRDQVQVLRSPQIDTDNDHGTGCTFAAAAAATLARGEAVLDAVLTARAFVRLALRSSASWRLGAGHGPVAHTIPTFFGVPALPAADPVRAVAPTAPTDSSTPALEPQGAPR